jgi:hypothetical protein
LQWLLSELKIGTDLNEKAILLRYLTCGSVHRSSAVEQL